LLCKILCLFMNGRLTLLFYFHIENVIKVTFFISAALFVLLSYIRYSCTALLVFPHKYWFVVYMFLNFIFSTSVFYHTVAVFCIMVTFNVCFVEFAFVCVSMFIWVMWHVSEALVGHTSLCLDCFSFYKSIFSFNF